jgi:hypothetical protein
MRKQLPVLLAIFPLVVTAAIVFEVFDKIASEGFLLSFLLAAAAVGWVSVGFCPISRRWLKVLALVLYPFLMLPLLFLAAVRHLPIL